MISTQSQQNLKLASECVSQLKGKGEQAKIYGRLCHSFPVLVQNSGLCQTLAFHLAKTGKNEKPREQAHEKLLEHVAKVLDVPRADLFTKVQSCEVEEYSYYTRRIITAFAYFKRFAVSVLKVENGGDDD